MSDVPSPCKKELPEYNEREERMLSMIYEKFLGSDLTQMCISDRIKICLR